MLYLTVRGVHACVRACVCLRTCAVFNGACVRACVRACVCVLRTCAVFNGVCVRAA